MTLFAEFIICAILIFILSHSVSRYGKEMAKRMNWREGFVGIIFLAFATSLPEIATSISSLIKTGQLSLGFGDSIGSVIMNLMVIFLLRAVL